MRASLAVWGPGARLQTMFSRKFPTHYITHAMPIIDALVERDTPTAKIGVDYHDLTHVFLGGVIMGPMVTDFLCKKYTNLGDTYQYILQLCEVSPSVLIEGAPK